MWLTGSMNGHGFAEVLEVVAEIEVQLVRIAVNVDFDLFFEFLADMIDGVSQKAFEEMKIVGVGMNRHSFQSGQRDG